MANPEVDRLIEELSNVLNRNREQRNAADAMLQGIEQRKARAAAARNQPAATGQATDPTGLGKLSPNYRANTGFNEAYKKTEGDQDFARAFNKYQTGYGGDTHASAYVGPQVSPRAAHIMPAGNAAPGSSYGGDAGMNPYPIQPQASAATLSPSTTPAGRIALAQEMIRAQQPTAPVATQDQIDKYFRLKGSSPEAMDPAVTQALRVSPADAAALDKAGNPDLGNFGDIVGKTMSGSPSSSYGHDKAYAIQPIPARELRQSVSKRISPSEAALLDELSKRYISPEEMAKR